MLLAQLDKNIEPIMFNNLRRHDPDFRKGVLSIIDKGHKILTDENSFVMLEKDSIVLIYSAFYTVNRGTMLNTKKINFWYGMLVNGKQKYHVEGSQLSELFKKRWIITLP